MAQQETDKHGVATVETTVEVIVRGLSGDVTYGPTDIPVHSSVGDVVNLVLVSQDEPSSLRAQLFLQGQKLEKDTLLLEIAGEGRSLELVAVTSVHWKFIDSGRPFIKLESEGEDGAFAAHMTDQTEYVTVLLSPPVQSNVHRFTFVGEVPSEAYWSVGVLHDPPPCDLGGSGKPFAVGMSGPGWQWALSSSGNYFCNGSRDRDVTAQWAKTGSHAIVELNFDTMKGSFIPSAGDRTADFDFSRATLPLHVCVWLPQGAHVRLSEHTCT